jgi:hypothetical protein
MLTKNRREYLRTRDKEKKAEYDYRVRKWLEAMLDSGEEGGIGDINRVLDTLNKDAVRKHLKDENVYELLRLVIRLLDLLDFSPIDKTDRGRYIVTTQKGFRLARQGDFERNEILGSFCGELNARLQEPFSRSDKTSDQPQDSARDLCSR